jgi:hypothetical protein
MHISFRDCRKSKKGDFANLQIVRNQELTNRKGTQNGWFRGFSTASPESVILETPAVIQHFKWKPTISI